MPSDEKSYLWEVRLERNKFDCLFVLVRERYGGGLDLSAKTQLFHKMNTSNLNSQFLYHFCNFLKFMTILGKFMTTLVKLMTILVKYMTILANQVWKRR